MKRTIYFDYLRVFATFAVILLHLAGQNWNNADVNSFNWQVFNVYDSIVRWAVPVFVMISGALFLERSISLKKIYLKYVVRLFISFYVWSLIYILLADTPLSLFEKATLLVSGHFHMWFIPMMAGLYICTPFFKIVANDERITKYYLCLAFLLSSLIPTIVILINDFTDSVFINGIASAIKISAQSMKIYAVTGYAGYFILGYYLNNKDLTKYQRRIIYILGIVGFVLTIVLTYMNAIKLQKPNENYYDFFSVNVLLESIAVFVFFKYRKFKANNLIAELSKNSYGVYLVHALIMEILSLHFGINTFSYNAVIAVPGIGMIVFITSHLISLILNHIPYINKYIV